MNVLTWIQLILATAEADLPVLLQLETQIQAASPAKQAAIASVARSHKA